MRDVVIGAVLTAGALWAFLLLVCGEFVFGGLPIVKKLRATANRISLAEFDTTLANKQPLADIVQKQLYAICYGIHDEDRFYHFGRAVDIISLREDSHRRFLKQVRSVSSALLALYFFRVSTELYRNNFAVSDWHVFFGWVGKEPTSVVGVLEAMTLIFLFYKFLSETEELRDILQ